MFVKKEESVNDDFGTGVFLLFFSLMAFLCAAIAFVGVPYAFADGFAAFGIIFGITGVIAALGGVFVAVLSIRLMFGSH